jgi:hypothetical protein
MQQSERALIKGFTPRTRNKAQKEYTYALGRTLWVREQTWAMERVYSADGAVSASNLTFTNQEGRHTWKTSVSNETNILGG